MTDMQNDRASSNHEESAAAVATEIRVVDDAARPEIGDDTDIGEGGELDDEQPPTPKSRKLDIRIAIDPIGSGPSTADGGAHTGADKPVPKNRRSLATLRAKADLNAACARVEEEWSARTGGDQEGLVLAKLAEHRAWLIRHGFLPALTDGVPSEPLILAQIGHDAATITDAIGGAIAALSELVVENSPFFRSDVDPTVDVLIDVYRDEMTEREQGLPRSGWSGRRCWDTAAKEIGCTKEQLTPLRRRRLRMIDDAIGTSGEVVGSKHLGGRRLNRVGAAIALLHKELARRRGRMPADPLQPDAVDVPELAEAAGAASRDFSSGPRVEEIRAAIEEARGGKPLVPHPMIAQRRFTYGILKDHGKELRVAEATAAEVRDPLAAGRVTVGALTKFMSIAGLGGRTADVVPLDFPERVERALGMPNNFDSGWASQMRRWVAYYHQVRSGRPLPEVFATAIKILAVEVGVDVPRMAAAAGPAARAWLSGWALPRHESEPALRQLEDLLKVTRGTLSGRLAREWRARRLEVNVKKSGYTGVTRKLPLGLSDLPKAEQLKALEEAWKQYRAQDTEFSRLQSTRTRDHYRLPFDAWPQSLKDAWKEQIPEVDDGTGPGPDEVGLREPGTRPGDDERHSAIKEEDRRWRSKTEELGETQLGFWLGFLVRAETLDDAKPFEAAAGRRAPQRLEPTDRTFEPEPGLGMPRELIHPALIAVVDLFTVYGHWKSSRSGGRFAPTVAQTLKLAAEFLKPKTGLVWKNPKWLKHLERFHEWWTEQDRDLPRGSITLDIDAFREDWHTAVTEAYVLICKDAKDLRPKKRKGSATQPKKLRDPFIPIAGYLRENDPIAAYMVGVRQMLASKPLSMLDRHEHKRNGILALILVQTGLRAGTLQFTISGPEPTLRREKDAKGRVRWRIVIPARHFKNWYSPFFSDGRPYEFELDDEDGLYEMMDDYMERGREYLLAGAASDAFFITRMGRAYTALSLSETYRKVTSMFFVHDEETGQGIRNVRPHGLHAVRHVIATSLLKTTHDIYQAAYAIQDTPRTVEKSYALYLPRDKALLAVRQMRASRTRAAA